MTQRADIADQTAGSGTGPSGDGTSSGVGSYGSGQTGARVMLGILLVICVVGLIWALWPEDRSASLVAAPSEESAMTGGETPGTDQMSVAPGTDRVDGNELTPPAADLDPADAGEGAGVDPDMDTTDEEQPRDEPEIDPTDTVDPVDPPNEG